MSVIETITEDIGLVGKGVLAIEHFVTKAFADVEKVKSAIDSLPPSTKSDFAKIFADLAAVTATTVPAVGAKFVSIPLDIEAFSAIRQFVSDAKAGAKDAETFFSVLNIKL